VAHAAVPANDERADATFVSASPFFAEPDLATATLDGPAESCGTNVTADVWYRLEAATSATVSVSAFAPPWSGADPLIEVRDASSDAVIACNDDREGTPEPTTAALVELVATGPVLVRIANAAGGVAGEVLLTISGHTVPSTGEIGGVVRDIRTDVPIDGVCVRAERVSGTFLERYVISSETGQYRIGGLPPGDYDVRFTDDGSGWCGVPYAPPVRDRYLSRRLPDLVGVGTGLTDGHDVGLRRGGIVTGTIVGSDGGAGLDGICVVVRNPTGDAVAFGSTSATGAYRVGGLRRGDGYQVGFEDCSARADRYAPADRSLDIVPDREHPLDVALDPGGAISGRVTSEAGVPLHGVEVQIHGTDATFWGTAWTDPSGQYRLSGLAGGEYHVRFDGASAAPVFGAPEWFDDAPDRAGATAVAVHAGATSAGVDAALGAGGTIEGVVTDAVTGAPIEWTCIEVASPDLGTYRFAQTDRSGAYRIGGLVGAELRVRAFCGYDPATARPYASKWFDDAIGESRAAALAVGNGESRVVNFALEHAAMLSGRVVGAGDPSRGIAGVCVSLWHGGDLVAESVTGGGIGIFDHLPVDDGGFTFSEVNPRDYILRADDCAGEADVHLPFESAIFLAPGESRSDEVVALRRKAAPGAPAGVTATAGDATATVSWTPTDNGAAAITGFRVTAAPGGATVLVEPGITTVSFPGLTNGVTYTFAVDAFNEYGVATSEPSNPVTPTAPVVAPGGGTVPPPVGASGADGYWMVGTRGAVYAFGGAPYLGGHDDEIVDLEPTASGRGYWLAGAGGGVYAFGDAPVRGAMPVLSPGERVAALVGTASGAGYWLVTTRGRVFPYGDAVDHGGVGHLALNAPIADAVATPTGGGYYLVAADGGVFALGDARFHGSMGGARVNGAVVSLALDRDGDGYWLVAADGGVFAYRAPFRGSMAGVALNRPIAGMVARGDGYLMVGADGGTFNFSALPFLGSLGASPPPLPIVGVAATG
jgi:hypothetical protein